MKHTAIRLAGNSDVAHTLGSVAPHLADIRGASAAIMLGCYSVVALTTGLLWAVGDLYPSLAFGRQLQHALLAQVIDTPLVGAMPLVPWLAMLFPTAFQLGAVRLMKADVMGVRVGFWGSVFFDAATDYPTISTVVAHFLPLGNMQTLVAIVCLVLCSFVIQVVFFHAMLSCYHLGYNACFSGRVRIIEGTARYAK